ncbi:hypothetical protein SSS_03117 [Sarcoptes scabiei]|uniref:Uncharacterized protein n=1 Tax=Sarcoptes scabiei TaxID=52283 RepID=A0A834R8G8_SARSC|nr:hypothetical protein SSS_03117 [Sarcoptes scabiei]
MHQNRQRSVDSNSFIYESIGNQSKSRLIESNRKASIASATTTMTTTPSFSMMMMKRSKSLHDGIVEAQPIKDYNQKFYHNIREQQPHLDSFYSSSFDATRSTAIPNRFQAKPKIERHSSSSSSSNRSKNLFPNGCLKNAYPKLEPGDQRANREQRRANHNDSSRSRRFRNESVSDSNEFLPSIKTKPTKLHRQFSGLSLKSQDANVSNLNGIGNGGGGGGGGNLSHRMVPYQFNMLQNSLQDFSTNFFSMQMLDGTEFDFDVDEDDDGIDVKVPDHREFDDISSDLEIINHHNANESGEDDVEDVDDDRFKFLTSINPSKISNQTWSSDEFHPSQFDSKLLKMRKNSKKLSNRFYFIRQQNYPPLYLQIDSTSVNSSSSSSSSSSANIVVNNEIDDLNRFQQRKRIYRTLILGYPSVGKTSLVKQFRSMVNQQQSIYAWDPTDPNQLTQMQNIFMHFVESNQEEDSDSAKQIFLDYQPDIILIVFSVNVRDSFNFVKTILSNLNKWDDLEERIILIVANKCDLVRSRCITKKGRQISMFSQTQIRINLFPSNRSNNVGLEQSL